MTRRPHDATKAGLDEGRRWDVCPACGVDGAPPAHRIDSIVILRCRSCGLGWWNFSAWDSTAFYERDYYFAPAGSPDRGYENYNDLAPAQRKTSRRRLKKIHGVTKRASCLLDVGCGLGHFLAEAKAQGWQASGFEVSRFAAGEVRKRLGIPVFDGDLASVPGSFEVITAWDVLEHVRDPLAFLACCRRLLSLDGHLILSTGNFASLTARLSGRRWHLFNLPEHLFFHTPKSIGLMAVAAGLQINDLAHPAAYYPISYLRERLRRKTPLRLPTTFLDGVVVPVNLFDIMEVWLQRPEDSPAGGQSDDV